MPRAEFDVLQFSADGRTLTGAGEEEVARWDVPTGERRLSRDLENWAATRAVALSPDGQLLLGDLVGHGVRIEQVEDGRARRDRRHRDDARGEPERIAWSADLKRAVIGLDGGKTELWDLGKLRASHTLDHGRTITGAAFAPDGATVVTTSYDKSLRVWSTGDGALACDAPMDSWPLALDLSEDGRWAAIGLQTDGGGVLAIHDARTCAQRVESESPVGPLRAVASSADGSHIAFGGDAGVAVVWSVESRSVSAVLEIDADYVEDLAFSPDGRWLAAGGRASAELWDWREGRKVHEVAAGSLPIQLVRFDATGARLLIAGMDRRVRVLKPSSGEVVEHLPVHENWVFSTAAPPALEPLLVSLAGHTETFAYALSGEQVSVLPVETARDLAVSDSASHAAAAHSGDVVSGKGARVELFAKGDDRWANVAGVSHVGSHPVAFDLPGKRLLSGGKNDARIWTVPALEPVATLPHPAPVADAVFGPAGKRAFTASKDGWVRV